MIALPYDPFSEVLPPATPCPLPGCAGHLVRERMGDRVQLLCSDPFCEFSTVLEHNPSAPGGYNLLQAYSKPLPQSDNGESATPPAPKPMSTQPCAVPGCALKAASVGLCFTHVSRFRRQRPRMTMEEFIAAGGPLPARQIRPGRPTSGKVCAICRREAKVRGLCSLHYQQWYHAGRPDLAAWLQLNGANDPTTAQTPAQDQAQAQTQAQEQAQVTA